MIQNQWSSSAAYDFPVRQKRTASPSAGMILLVEDEDFVREAAFQILQGAGYRVLKARNAVEALRMFQQYNQEIELLLTDVVIPGQNGGELAHDLKAMNQELKIIFISGYPENTVTKYIQEIGAWYLPKPFSLELLVRKVHQVMSELNFEEEEGPEVKRAFGIV